MVNISGESIVTMLTKTTKESTMEGSMMKEMREKFLVTRRI